MLVAGGFDGPYDSAELYDPATGTWASAGHMATGRAYHTAGLLADGRVLVANGQSGGGEFDSAELYTPATTRAASGGTFGATDVGTAAEQDVVVTNTGGDPLLVSGATITGDDAADFSIVTDGCSHQPIVPVALGATCTVRVRFTPSAFGSRQAQLELDDNAVPSDGIPIGIPPHRHRRRHRSPRRPRNRSPRRRRNRSPHRRPHAHIAQPKPKPQPSCTSKRLFTVSLTLPKHSHVRSGTATLNGKRIATLHASSRSVRVDLRKKPAGAYTLRIRYRTGTGHSVTILHRYRTCAG